MFLKFLCEKIQKVTETPKIKKQQESRPKIKHETRNTNRAKYNIR